MHNIQIERYSLAQIFWERRWLLIIAMVLAIIVTGIYAYRLPPEFQTEIVLRLHTPTEIEASGQSYIPALAGITNLMKSQDVLLQAIIEGKFFSENQAFSEWTHPYAINWLGSHLSITHPEKTDLLVVQLYGPFSGGRKIREFMERYWVAFQKKMQAQFQQNLRAEQERLESFKKSLMAERDSITQEATRRATSKSQLLQSQEEELQQTLVALKSNRNLRIPAGEQNASFEGIALRQEYQTLQSQLADIQKQLRLIKDDSVVAFADLQSEFGAIEQDLGKLNLLLLKLRHLSENFSALELVNAPLEPKAPTGPSKTGIMLLGGVIGLLIGLLLIFFLGPVKDRRKASSAN
jgi:uncharacterized protein involved in exopolysaccharide biosynthesis